MYLCLLEGYERRAREILNAGAGAAGIISVMREMNKTKRNMEVQLPTTCSFGGDIIIAPYL